MGNSIPDGARVVLFKIYDAPVSGAAVWAGEVHKLSVNGGLVNTVLGTKAAFPDRYGSGRGILLFSEPLYLEITVDANADAAITSADPPLLPRHVLLPANFAQTAMSAETVQGVEILNEETKKLDANVLAGNSIPGAALVDRSVGANQVSVGAIGSEEIADGTIGNADLSAALKRLLGNVVPSGAIMPFGGPNIPEGWLLCDGRALDKDADEGLYQSLFDAIGSSWGDGSTGVGSQADLTEFNLPDTRGRFLRGVAGESELDRAKERDERGASAPGGESGNKVGSRQGDGIGEHIHTVLLRSTHNDERDGKGFFLINSATEQNGPIPKPSLVNDGAKTETRPANVYVNYIIKY